ncbi:dihydrodiol dehydrogenase [Streptomyces sp. NPDC002088]|uniref:dihydrodiol dehydrogenase n=1 Tax=Streptomyces sp. NPDC002088 TaxID=3154665 RepID=UPI0033184551
MVDTSSHTPNIERPDIGEESHYPEGPSTDGPIIIANEFADVVIRKVETRNGMRLDIWSPRRGSRVLLDAVALDCLSFQEPDFITEMLARRPAP